MKIIGFTSVGHLVPVFWLASLVAQGNDLNPALVYYRAFLALPEYSTEFSSEDRAYLFETNWYGRPLDERFGRLLS